MANFPKPKPRKKGILKLAVKNRSGLKIADKANRSVNKFLTQVLSHQF